MSVLVDICYAVIGALVLLIITFPIAMFMGKAISRNQLSDEEICEINARLGIALTREDVR